MKTILLHLDDHESLPAMMMAALMVAQRFGSHIEGLHVRPSAPRMVPMGPEGAGLATADLMESLEREGQRVSVRVHERFDAFMREHGVPIAASMPPSDQPSASWYEEVAAGEEALASRGRAFDLIVAGRPVPGPVGPRMSVLEAALFESGRPILVVPPAAPRGSGEVVLVAWNGSEETARTIGLCMPFLLGAKDVLVFSVEEGMVPGPAGRDVAQNLIRHNIPARAKHVACGNRGAVGACMLKEAADIGADVMLKGAYTQSRLRQMIFGGATSHILSNAELPVLMAN
jgi:nucleotide-binding universal stress UspA family protein